MPTSKPEWFEDHEREDKEQFEKIGNALVDIRDNHLTHIQIAQERQATDMTWLKWLVMGIAGGIGALAIAYVAK